MKAPQQYQLINRKRQHKHSLYTHSGIVHVCACTLLAANDVLGGALMEEESSVGGQTRSVRLKRWLQRKRSAKTISIPQREFSSFSLPSEYSSDSETDSWATDETVSESSDDMGYQLSDDDDVWNDEEENPVFGRRYASDFREEFHREDSKKEQIPAER